ILKQIQKALANFPELEFAMLFGSLASGKANDRSDLDLAVMAGKPLDAEAKIKLIGALANKTGRSIDLIDFRAVGQPLLNEIIKNGKIIIKNETIYANLMVKNIFDNEDFLPYRNRILEERREAWISK
ncbi:MAG: nucleotidyltransferase domain-containing protein, partial [Arenicellales bacterium]